MQSRHTYEQSKTTHKLTAREQEILEMMATGKTNQQIAALLNISHHTIKNHVHNIYGKLDTKNRTEAVAKGMAWGLWFVARNS